MKKGYLFILLLTLILPACTRDISPNTYSVGSVGMASRTAKAVIINVRDVNISGNNSGVGTGIGIASGAVAGSSIGSTSTDNAVGAIGLAVVGGIIGATIENNSTAQKGVEYVIETDNGNLISLVQGSHPKLNKNDKVLLIYGNPSRIISQ